jgi:hypothetical protein
VNEKKLIVLGIYPYDDEKLWKKANYPKMMINGWNKSRQIENNELYDLPTLPCFYLLDKDYKVLIKNEGSLNKVEAMLQSLTGAQETGPAPEAAAPAAKPAQPAKPKPVVTPAPADDPNTARSEQILNYFINNQGEELFNNLSDKVKTQAQPNVFDNAFSKIEEQLGKYQNHEPWQIQQAQGLKAYTSILNFEKGPLGMVIVFDEVGKMMGVNMVPAQAIKAN